MRSLALAGLLAFAVVLPVNAQPPMADPDVEALVKGNNEFAFALHQKLAQGNDNAFYSPYSISTALAMTYAGARNTTAAEMQAALRFTLPQEKLHPAFGKLIAQTNDKKRPLQLSVANRLWGQRGYGFLKPFLNITSEHYGAPLEEIDYRSPGGAEQGRAAINRWVEEKTNKKIRDIIPKGALDTRTRLVLTNAIYFKASWAIPFNEKSTKPDTFHALDGSTTKPKMMHGSLGINYMRNDDFALVELPYEKHDASMIVILPHKKDGLAAVEKKLSVEGLQGWVQALLPHQVDLKLPKFTLESSFNLNGAMKELGMKDAFDEIKADLRNMGVSQGDMNLYISDILHKAFLGIDEKSTEAAAATAVIVKATKSAVRPPPHAVFHVDRPFVLLIHDNRTRSILFMGRIAKVE